jgi:hypothetical protein
LTVRGFILFALIAASVATRALAQDMPFAPAAPTARGLLTGTGAVLQGLDKITARVRPLELDVGETLAFGALRITLRACRKAPPEEAPESAAFVEIDEVRTPQFPIRLFSGWMFASSPALSALEHAVYDVWVTDCKNAAKAPAGISR